jgi:membrane protein implicated in regulation of membrane protease activity
MWNMKKSLGFYAVVAGILVVVVGLLVGLALAGKWIAFITIAILAILMLVFLSDMPSGQKRSR